MNFVSFYICLTCLSLLVERKTLMLMVMLRCPDLSISYKQDISTHGVTF